MPGKAVMWLLTVTALTRGASVPRPDHITLHLQPDLLRGHRLVLSLEPLPDPSTRPDKVSESLSANETLAEGTREEEEEEATTTHESASTATPTPDATTEGAEETATTVVSPFAFRQSPFAVEADVDELLITIPNVQCPQGLRPDHSGRCRSPFGSPLHRGRSLGSAFRTSARTKGNSLSKASERRLMHPEGKNEV